MSTKLKTNIKLRGGKSAAGEKYIGFKQRGSETFLPVTMAASDDLVQLLGVHGIIVGGRAAAAQLMESAAEIESFTPIDILTHPGWNGPVFVRANGLILAPKNVANVAASGIGFRRHPGRQRRAGKQSEVKRRIIPTLLSDDGPTLLLCASLAPTIRPLLSRSVAPFGLQVIAPTGTEKLRRIAQSLIGSMSPVFLAGDSVEDLMNSPGVLTAAAQDNPLLVGDLGAYLHGAADKSRKAAARRLLFDHLISTGGDVNAVGNPAPMALFIERRSIATALDLDREAGDGLTRGVVTIDLGAGVAAGNGTEARPVVEGRRPWNDVISDLGAHYGCTLFTFQQRLVERRAEVTLIKLQAKLDGYFSSFCKRVSGAYPAQHLPDHVVHPFALLYTAYRAARFVRVIPRADPACSGLWRLFQAHVASRPKPPTATTILAEIAALPGVRHVNGLDQSLGKSELSKAPAFIEEKEDGTRELLVWSKQKRSLFNWSTFKKLPDYPDHFIEHGDKGHLGVKLVIGGWTGQRFLRFRLA
jgi:hypothetical protein